MEGEMVRKIMFLRWDAIRVQTVPRCSQVYNKLKGKTIY